MQLTDKPKFALVLSSCLAAIYDKPVTPLVLEAWFMALSAYPLEEIEAAFGRHLVNPDTGAFPPKPADLVRLMDGGSEGRALSAWALVEKAIRMIGGYRSVTFDDPLIHTCLSDMGGWVALCTGRVDELPFRANEFAKRYRAALLKPPQTYRDHLPGRAEAENACLGYETEPPLLLGNPDQALRVQRGGTRDVPRLAHEKSAEIAISPEIAILENAA